MVTYQQDGDERFKQGGVTPDKDPIEPGMPKMGRVTFIRWLFFGLVIIYILITYFHTPVLTGLGKYLIVMDQLTRAYGGELIRRNYYQLKKYLLPYPKQNAKWGPHTSAYLWSIACGTDLRPLFQDFNIEVDWDSLEHKQLRELPFDMQLVAKQFGIPKDKYMVPPAVEVDTVIQSLMRDLGRQTP